VSSKDNFVVIGVKLEVIVLKVGLVLGEESLKGFFLSFIGAGLIYLVGSSLLGYIKEIDFLLESCDLDYHILDVIIANARKG
jgi:hypothetical protein